MPTVTVWPEAIVTTVHVTTMGSVPDCEQLTPLPGVMVMVSSAGGSVSLICTLLLVRGPLFVALSEYVIGVPIVPVAGPVCVNARSAFDLIVKFTVAGVDGMANAQLVVVLEQAPA
jgi:hypothetical protein